MTDLDALTGLAEYRNGGLFLDGGLLVPRSPALLAEVHDVGSPVVVEWRALTVALLDRVAAALRARLGLDADACRWRRCSRAGPGGPAASWPPSGARAAGRRCRSSSDGTVF